MEDILAQLATGASPISALIGIGAMLLVNYLRTKKILPDAKPVTPAPTPAPVPAPDAPAVPSSPLSIPGRPILNLALQLLPLLLQRKAAAAVTPSGPVVATVVDPAEVLEAEVLRQVANSV